MGFHKEILHDRDLILQIACVARMICENFLI